MQTCQEEPDRFVDWPWLTITGSIAILGRWHACAPEKGGLRLDSNRVDKDTNSSSRDGWLIYGYTNCTHTSHIPNGDEQPIGLALPLADLSCGGASTCAHTRT